MGRMPLTTTWGAGRAWRLLQAMAMATSCCEERRGRSRSGRHDRAMRAAGRNDEREEDERRERARTAPTRPRSGSGTRSPATCAAVERRDREQVEDRERRRSADHETMQELERAAARADERPGAKRASTRPSDHRRDERRAAKFESGPAALDDACRPCAMLMPRRNRAGFTGTGFAQPNGAPDERQEERPDGIDVRDRVEREPAHPRRGVVAELPRATTRGRTRGR